MAAVYSMSDGTRCSGVLGVLSALPSDDVQGAETWSLPDFENNSVVIILLDPVICMRPNRLQTSNRAQSLCECRFHTFHPTSTFHPLWSQTNQTLRFHYWNNKRRSRTDMIWANSRRISYCARGTLPSARQWCGALSAHCALVSSRWGPSLRLGRCV